MKVKVVGGEGSINLYSLAVIENKLKKEGVELVEDISNADFLFLSVCDPTEISMVKKESAQAEEFSVPVVMGGFESFFAIPYFAWVDYVVVGEGFDFFEAFAESPEKAFALDCVMSSPEDTVYPNYNIHFKEMPLLKVPGRNRFYYLAGKGCKGKCKFCGTSWVQPHQENSKYRVKRILRKVEDKPWGKINLISNDSGLVYESKAINAQSCRVSDYLRRPDRYKSNMLHFGIEAWTEGRRKEWGKPVSPKEIIELLKKTKEKKQECELFFIVSYKDWSLEKVERFAEECLIPDADKSPRVFVKLTYFDPVPHTPLGDEKIELSYCDPEEVFKILNSRNKRVRVFPTRSMARTAWRGVFHRCKPEEAKRLGAEPSDTNKAGSFSDFKEHLRAEGLLYRLEKTNDYYENIKARISL